MGRDAGHLALHAGIAGGADSILIPELTPQITSETLRGMCSYIAGLREHRRKFALIVVAEGVQDINGNKDPYIAETLARLLKEYSVRLCGTNDRRFCNLQHIDTRSTVLGHLQRCGVPSSFDRILATVFAIKALDLIADECYNRLVIWQNGAVQSKSLEQIMPLIKWCHQEGSCPSPVDAEGFMVRTALSLGIYLGESHKHPHTASGVNHDDDDTSSNVDLSLEDKKLS